MLQNQKLHSFSATFSTVDVRWSVDGAAGKHGSPILIQPGFLRNGGAAWDVESLARQNEGLRGQLHELEQTCSALREENALLRKSSSVDTEDKVRRLKRKNAELVAIAKRLEERAKKLQEANMRVATTPAPLKLQAVEQYRKAFARQRARDLGSQAAALLSKDKQVDALQREVYRLRHLLHLLAPEGLVEPESDTERLLVASQKEVLRLQRQLSVATGKRPPSLPSPDKGRQISGASQPALRAPPERLRAVEESNRSLKAEVKKLKQEVQRSKRLEGELSKKRKEAEVLEQDVKKRKRRCQDLECELKERHQENVRLGKETARLQHRTQQHEREKTEWQERVKAAEAEKGYLTEENHQLRAKLDRFEKAQAETNKDHDDVVQVLEAKVHDLEEWCRTHVHHQFGQLTHELERFGLHKAHGDAVNGGASRPPETQPQLHAATRGGPEATGPPTEPSMTAEAGAGRHELTGAAAVAAAWSSPGPLERMDGTACVAHVAHVAHVAPLPAGGEAASGGASCPQDQPTHIVAEQPPRLRGRLQHGSLSRSFSMEVDTASEVDDLDTDHVSPISSLAARGKSKLQVFIARYSYNPFEGPNENPEAELPLAAGEYVYVYGDMDEDGFYEGELMDGRRGLVPSNFIERISDEDLVAFHQMEGEHSLSQQQHLHHVHHHHHSCPDRDRTRPASACSVCWEGQCCPGQCPNPCQNKCRAEVPAPPCACPAPPCGTDGVSCKCGRSSETPHRCCGAPYGCNVGQSLPRLGTPNCTEDIDAEEAPPLQDDPRVRHPRGIALIKQLAKSVIISWEPPPLLPPPARTSASSSPSLSTSSSSSASFSAAAPTSYNVLVDDELRMNVRASAKPKALVEKLELSARSYRVSVQGVTARGLSDPALCSLLVGAGATPAPRQLAVRDMTPSSAVLTWLPSSSSHAHMVRANGEERGEVAAGVRAFTLLGLEPDRHYRVVVEARPQRSHWEPSPEERRRREASIAFRTPPAGLPDAPLHVQVEAGQSTGTLLVSWLPVTIDAMGSSNGSCVTGYAIFADGAKVLEVACPTAGSAVLDSSLCEGSSSLTVRTLSPRGSSPHSLAARLLHLPPPPDPTGSPEGPSPPPPPSPVAGAHAGADGSGTPTRRARSVSKLKMCNHAAGWGSPSRAEPMAAVGEAWYHPATDSSGQTLTDEARLRATEIPCDTGSMGDVPDTLATVQLCAAGSPARADATPSPIVPAVRFAEPPRLLNSEVVGFVPPADGESDCAEASQAKSEEEHGSTQPLCSSMEEFLREMEQDRLIPPPRLEGYQTESSRGSELSDILEEDEEDLMSESVKRSEAQRRRLNYPLREVGEGCDTDSDEESLEAVLELPLQKQCSKKLFSIPELTEEEEEDDEEEDDDEKEEDEESERGLRDAFEELAAPHVPLTPGRKLWQKYDCPGRVKCGSPGCSGQVPRESPKHSSRVRKSSPELLGIVARESPKNSFSIAHESREVWPGLEKMGCTVQRDRFLRRSRFAQKQAEAAVAERGHADAFTEDVPLDNVPALQGREGAAATQADLCRTPSDGGKRSHEHNRRSPKARPRAAECRHPTNDGTSDGEKERPVARRHVEETHGRPVAAAAAWRSRKRGLTRQSTVEEDFSDTERGSEMAGGDSSSGGGGRGGGSSSSTGDASATALPASRADPRERERSSAARTRAVVAFRQEQPKHGDTAPSGDAPSVAQSAPGGDAAKPGNACPSADAGVPWTNPGGAAERGPQEGVVPVRIFVALFDYDPMSMSPNPDAADEELPFREGQVIKVYGDKDGDGFYLGEAGGQRGFVPCNMVSELQVEEQAVLQEILRRGFLPPDAPLDQIGLDGRGCWQAGVTARRMIALFDYDPRESSPNVDIEAELSFTAGDIIAIYGDMDEDGFYFGELNSQTGLVPSNFLEEVPGDLEVALSIPDEREADNEQQAEKAAEEAMQDESRAGDHEDAPLDGKAACAAEAARPPAAPQPPKAEGPPAEGPPAEGAAAAAAAGGGGGRSDEEASAEKASALLSSPATSGGGSPKTHGSSSSPASSLEGSPRKKKGLLLQGQVPPEEAGTQQEAVSTRLADATEGPVGERWHGFSMLLRVCIRRRAVPYDGTLSTTSTCTFLCQSIGWMTASQGRAGRAGRGGYFMMLCHLGQRRLV
ncbi:peripheral-type benzodiazepine receptor-associated protein 1-like isoform X4 [Lethenteron reissneri]|uniref:peripheral-type benzodiazepine receptor-associated protein 1-like isoform X4 n=1 Tax=Lethenteron reissneri TaxID=7753 RepID=UPI002AB7D022|nr:peripheral-type benzodiazepine receptor-associated protein 1-like isoform X4 [Lethenteron reissneri]